jgi:hypothetical protein
MSNQKNRTFISAAIFSVAMLMLFTFFSCKKEGKTIAEIFVVDSAGSYVGNASVTLWQDTSISTQSGQQANIRVTRPTDSGGRAEFEFSLEAYLNILAIKNNDTAKGVILLKEHEKVSKTVGF